MNSPKKGDFVLFLLTKHIYNNTVKYNYASSVIVSLIDPELLWRLVIRNPRQTVSYTCHYYCDDYWWCSVPATARQLVVQVSMDGSDHLLLAEPQVCPIFYKNKYACDYPALRSSILITCLVSKDNGCLFFPDKHRFIPPCWSDPLSNNRLTELLLRVL